MADDQTEHLLDEETNNIPGDQQSWAATESVGDETETPSNVVDDSTAPTDEESATGLDEADVTEKEAMSFILTQGNAPIFGELILHFAERDVPIILDGETAARVIATFAEPWRRRRLQDRIDPATSPMSNMWSTFDLSRLLGASWIPGVATKADSRMTVDPPLPAALSS